MLYLVLFLVVFFGFNLALLYVKFRENEGKLKSQLVEAQNRLRDAEIAILELKQADSLHTREFTQARTFTAILDSLDAGVVVVGRDETVQYLNSYARRKFGKSDTDTIHVSYKTLPLISGQMESMRDAFQEALKGNTKTLVSGVTIKTGAQTLPVAVRLSSLKDAAGDIAGVSLVFYDISVDLDTKSQTQAAFSIFAHELRTPIAVVKTGVALVLENIAALDLEKVKQTLKPVYENINQLSELVNEVLNVSRLEQGKMTINRQAVDLVKLTEDVVLSLRPLAREKKLYLEQEKAALDQSQVLADRVKVQEILTNLIGNAIKYTFQGGITVSLMQENNQLSLLVRDTGVGIPSDQKRLLFQKFQQQGYSRTLGSGKSSGLGLYIAKQFARAMGGDVVLVKSEPNQGSEFKLTLPAVVSHFP